MIRQRLPLPPSCARCPSTRQVPCAQASDCARGVEPHSKNRPVNDFSTEPRMSKAVCGWFLPIQYVGQATAAPTVHDAPRGLL
jgi:hypothetical protein